MKISAINVVLLCVLVAAAVVTGVTGNWFEMTLLLLAAVFIFASAVYARGQKASDVLRLNAIEYRDERDRLLAKSGFAVVGIVALILAIAEFILAAVFQELLALASAQVLVLSAVWGVANSVAAKRG
ncbi:hypothetical protein [Salinibacterium sp. PAMC 21357]|uniref:hypothetical protein n=1 Tax=Salinibacterium sp. PAMC 21357 TaxID=1112215 RepID=UPI000288FF68|nr:hypothetical protein [Salinibacterium sp. PAMC 21357]